MSFWYEEYAGPHHQRHIIEDAAYMYITVDHHHILLGMSHQRPVRSLNNEGKEGSLTWLRQGLSIQHVKALTLDWKIKSFDLSTSTSNLVRVITLADTFS